MARTLGNNLSLPQGKFEEHYADLFPAELVELLAKLHAEFEPQRATLLQERQVRQKHYDQGNVPEYLDSKSEAASTDWQVASIPEDLLRRRVEITGPVNSAKMVLNMLNRNTNGARADMAMLDFEDSMKPSWNNVLAGFQNVIGAAKGDLNFEQGSKKYILNPEDMAGVMVRVRGLHLNESNVVIKDTPISAGLFDLSVCFFHTAKIFIKRGLTPKFYIPKCEHHLEARWWSKLFSHLEEALDLPKSTLRATFLIETLPAAIQIEEILFELKDHAAGLNVGRWDKIFSDIKVLKSHPDRVMADRSCINMQKYWMDNYAKRLIKICHSHGAFAIGGMSAFTPGKEEELRVEQTKKVSEDKHNESKIGHDGCWVSHPYFIGVAMEAFKEKNQLDRLLPDFDKYPDLIPEGSGPRTIEGLRTNIRVGIAYMQGWRNDIGCVSWDNLMEDLATLEISRSQTWQWMHNKVKLEDGTQVERSLIQKTFDQELDKIVTEVNESMQGQPTEKIQSTIDEFKQAKSEVENIFIEEELRDFFSMESDLITT